MYKYFIDINMFFNHPLNEILFFLGLEESIWSIEANLEQLIYITTFVWLVANSCFQCIEFNLLASIVNVYFFSMEITFELNKWLLVSGCMNTSKCIFIKCWLIIFVWVWCIIVIVIEVGSVMVQRQEKQKLRNTQQGKISLYTNL